MHNHGNFIVSLGQLVPWMSQRAESLGVDVFPGFAAADALVEDGRVAGVRLGDMGLDKDGKPGPNYAPGADIRAEHDDSRRGVPRQRHEKAHRTPRTRRAAAQPQTYGLGFKELWQLPPVAPNPG